MQARQQLEGVICFSVWCVYYHILSHYIWRLKKIPHWVQQQGCGSPHPSQEPLEVCYCFHPAGLVIGGQAGTDGDHLWNTDAGGTVWRNPLLQSVWPARTKVLSTKNPFKDIERRGIWWPYVANKCSWGLIHIHAHYSIDIMSFCFCRFLGRRLRTEKPSPCPWGTHSLDGSQKKLKDKFGSL